IHTYSLIHDDLPAMDNDDFRRGKPTNHKVYGEDIAILSGDGLLNYSFELMINNIPEGNERNYIHGVKAIARAAGCFGMIGGQTDDIKNENSGISIERLDSINGRKTGALIKASLLAGGYFSGMSPESLSQLEKYSERIGLAFQIVDDILDIVGDQEKTGKKAGSDSVNEKTTYPMKYGVEKSREIVQELHQEALVFLENSGLKSEFLDELTSFICIRDY
ncbi:MAG: polyprenyl synthetase family protein, partial [Eubacteriaceae bacterium]|nr:polyprenyl synthetase family protein [Eubacteriaceae bacterium]